MDEHRATVLTPARRLPRNGPCHRLRPCRDPVDTQLQRAMDRRDRILVLLRTPGKFPACPADGPGTKTHRRNVQIGIPKFSRFHGKPRTGGSARESAALPHEGSFFPSLLSTLDEQKEKKLAHRRLTARFADAQRYARGSRRPTGDRASGA